MKKHEVLAGWAMALASASMALGEVTIPAISQPSERRTLAFDSPGVVLDVKVKEGVAVKTGDVLMTQDTRMDEQEREFWRIDAESQVSIDAAQKEAELRQVQYERKKTSPEGYNSAEIEEAKLAAEVAKLKVIEATEKQKQSRTRFARQGVKVDLMQLRSKIDGVVEKINVDSGEMADPQKPEGAIVVVRNDPLWIDVSLLSTRQVAKLSPGQELEVRYEIDGADAPWQKAKIIFIAPVADARSDTQPVRLELANPGNRASGLALSVKLPADVAAAGVTTPASAGAGN